jgi:transposase InsO family protein
VTNTDALTISTRDWARLCRKRNNSPRPTAPTAGCRKSQRSLRIGIAAGFVYLAVILDAWSRRAIGYALGRQIDTRLALAALRAAMRPDSRRTAASTTPIAEHSTLQSPIVRNLLITQS